tara:strand:- start:786 stop:977 length:192 start_codon:yes stop_codon:yes gene_type:complete
MQRSDAGTQSAAATSAHEVHAGVTKGNRKSAWELIAIPSDMYSWKTSASRRTATTARNLTGAM